MSDYYLLQDSEMCIGCSACQVHCKSNKGLGPGPNLCRNMASDFIAQGGMPRVRFVFMPCFHCEHPWCVAVCPTGAMVKRAEDGLVVVQTKLCVGCQACVEACPWQVPQWDDSARKVVKCDYCRERVEQGQDPACVTGCTSHALSFQRPNLESRRVRGSYAKTVISHPEKAKRPD